MESYKLNVKCPVCDYEFKGHVLSSYKIEGYRYDFKPIFNRKNLLKYYIWFCKNCHFSGYDDRFTFKSYHRSYTDDEIKEIKSLKKYRINLPYKFYRAGEIGEILMEDNYSLLDYYLKSYWVSKDKKKKFWLKKSLKKLFELSQKIKDNPKNNEEKFVSTYLLGYLNSTKENTDHANYHFLDLIRMKNIPQKYKKYFNFALEYLKEKDEK